MPQKTQHAFDRVIDTPLIHPAEPLTCFDSTTAALRVSDDDRGCPEGLTSLGAYPLMQLGFTVTEVHPLLLARFRAARAVAAKSGVHLYITSGFRTMERQEQLFAAQVEKLGSKEKAGEWVLPGNLSHHPMGLALDINYPGDRAGARWLEVNGASFGLCRAYKNEWWHFEGTTAPGRACPPPFSNAMSEYELIGRG